MTADAEPQGPVGEDAPRHFSWVDESAETIQIQQAVNDLSNGAGSYVQYTGFPDGTFEVTVTLQRSGIVAIQSERSVGEKRSEIRDAMRKAYERADRAITTLEETGR